MRHRTRCVRCAARLVLLAGLVVTPSLQAAEPEQLQEIIVTAEKREESLQKTPLAVTAVTEEDLRRAGITDAQGLTDVVPGLEVGAFGSTTTFTIRGVTTNTDPNLGDSPTAFHIDGIYQGRPGAASGLFYDVARVEVLRGPQGTLYGKDSTGGTINVITNKPTFGGVSAEVEEELGNYYLRRTAGMLNVPLGDELAVRVAFQTLRHAGYLKTGYDDADDVAARAHLLWKPTDSFSALLTQDYFHQGGVGRGQVPLAELPGDNWGKDPWSANVNFGAYGLEPGFNGRTNNFSAQTGLQLDWNLGMAQLTSVSAYHHLHLDATAYLNGTPSLQQETDDEISQEFRIASAASSPVKWVAGAYYHRERQTNNLYFYDQAGYGVQPTANCDPFAPAAGCLEATDSYQIFPKIETPSYAVFGQLTYPITSRWRLTAGLRGTSDQKTVQGSIYQYSSQVLNTPAELTIPLTVPVTVDRGIPVPNGGCATPIGPNGSICPQAAPRGSLTARRFTWRLGTDYDLTPKSLVFLNVSTGYKQGGLDAAAPPNNIYRPETITAYEVGSKNRFFDDRLQVNLDAYLYDYKNYQVDQLEFFLGQYGSLVFGDFITNAASARHKGIELETRALVTGHDEIALNVAYLSAVFNSFQFPTPANPGNPSPQVTYENLSGYTEFLAPRWTATLSYQHVWELPRDAQLSVFALTHASSYYWLSPDHQPDSRQGGYTHSQAVLQYSSSQSRFTVQAFVRNIENRAVRNNYTFQGPPSPVSPGPLYLPPPLGGGGPPTRNFVTVDPPRTYGLMLTLRF